MARDLLDRLDLEHPADVTRRELALELIEDMERLDEQLKTSMRRMTAEVNSSNTTLLEIPGCGPVTAALILSRVRNIDRFPSRDHFAAYNATAPIEASSGERRRHRLNPKGNRTLNRADPHHRYLPAPLPRPRTGLLRPETSRGTHRQRSPPSPKTADLQHHLAAPHRRRGPLPITGEPGETNRDDSDSSVTALTLSAALRISHPQTPHQSTPRPRAAPRPPISAPNPPLTSKEASYPGAQQPPAGSIMQWVVEAQLTVLAALVEHDRDCRFWAAGRAERNLADPGGPGLR
jgi:hypothetical protein